MARCAGLRAGWVGVGLWLSAGAVMALERPDFNATLGAGYRVDDFSWNIAGNLEGTNPNVLSELNWRNNGVAEVRAGGEMWVRDGRWGVLANGVYGQIVTGEVQDSDYLGDDRTLEFSRSISTAGGELFGADLGLGYRTRLYDRAVNKYAVVTLGAGYVWQAQNLRARHGVQFIPPDGPFSGLDTRYDVRWDGPWAGAQIEMEAAENVFLSLGFKYAWTDYRAEADWNLREDFAHPVSFRHEATASGSEFTVGLRRNLTPRWAVGAVLGLRDWRADPGLDLVYSVDPDTGAVSALATRLNHVNWRSRGVQFQAQYRF